MDAPEQRQRRLQMVLLAVLTVLAAGTGVASLARQAAELGPSVGDIIAFDPARQVGFDGAAQLTAQRPGQADCILDLRLLQRTGGSLVLEGRTAPPDRLYTAHWSGGHTSNVKSADCGIDTNLTLSRLDVTALMAAASDPDPNRSQTARLR
jgi:hypothetical protein